MRVELNKLTTAELRELRARIDKRLRAYDESNAISPERIRDMVCNICCVSDEELPTRMRDAVTAKVIIADILRDLGYTAVVIGKLVGQDHATISHYKHTLEDWKACPAAFRREMRFYNRAVEQWNNVTAL